MYSSQVPVSLIVQVCWFVKLNDGICLSSGIFLSSLERRGYELKEGGS